jgi:hypothetical protein
MEWGEIMADSGGIVDQVKEILDKFRKEPEPNQEMVNQLKLLSEGDLQIHAETYPSNVYVRAEVERRKRLGGGGK